ncbi:hypothetical protein LIER_39444 [Lithospermum erythrorhizon]|uniref:Uncharacterized protein n=1 Tax=Lithospermum erythrorhizon TaxID=34254 RepID=A0AAV3QJ01_LITER
MMSSVSFKTITTGKDPLARISKRKNFVVPGSSSDAPLLAPVSKKSKQATKKTIPEDVPVDIEVMYEVFHPTSPSLPPPATIVIPDHVPVLDIVTSARESSPVAPPSKTSSGSGANLLGVPYSLPSGITVTEKTVSRREEPTASLLLKNWMLQRDMEGFMGYSYPSDLHDAFSHFQLKIFPLKLALSSLILNI